jgi:hypothetical protein
MTQETAQYHDIYLKIQATIGKIKEFNFYSYFCCIGTWNENTTCAITLKKRKTSLEEFGLFNKVEVASIDKNKLIDFYKSSSEPLQTTFDFIDRVQIRNIPNVDEAYIGHIPFSEFKKLIIDDGSGNLRNLFNDNIRDFLGLDNDVNTKIYETIQEKDFSKFPLYNNGITIIAEENMGRQEKFILNNYQIVNGCQTSNVLYNCRDVAGIDDTSIPIKLLITKDDALRDGVILSTNSQSKIDKEGLLALTTFQKQLESYYISANDKLFYERRSNQYANNTEVKARSIVTIREQIKSFVAIFLNEPEIVSGYFSKIYRDKKDQLFIADHNLQAYYVAGFLQCRFKELLNSKEIDRKYNKARYHIFMLFRMLCENEPFKADFIRKKNTKYFEHLLTCVRDKAVCLDKLKLVFQIIDSSGIDILNTKEIYRKTTTKAFIDSFNMKEATDDSK